MGTRCDICIEEDCRKKGREPGSCNCDACPILDKCTKVLRPTIRITAKCTQKCRHCCFSCSPSRSEMMTIETAGRIRLFLDANHIGIITLMGGEFFCNPSWREIFDILVPGMKYVRLVTNGDWATDVSVPDFLKKFKNMKVSISDDRWHTNEHVESAVRLCGEYGINCNTASESETTEDSVVPVGRGELVGFGFYSMFGTYCSNPEHVYSFMIDEEGNISKCMFGMWVYTHVDEHADGSFAPVFKETGQIFMTTFISNCASCARAYLREKRRQKQDGQHG